MIIITNTDQSDSPIRQSLIDAGCKLYHYSQVEDVNQLNPKHVVLFSGMGDYDRGLITGAANKLSSDITTGWWLGDLRDPDNHLHKHKLTNIDHLFVPSKNWLDRYNEFGPQASYVPQSGYAYCTDKFQYSNCNSYDAIFIGADKPTATHVWHCNRRPILKMFSKCCRAAKISDQSNTYAQTHMYKNIPISISITWPDAIGYSSNRLYNIAAAGGLAFQNYIPELDKMFTNHKHVVYYEKEQDIPDLVNHYLKNPEEVLNIKQAARKLFEEKHTGKARVQNMVDIMDGKTTDYYGYLK